MNPEAMNQASRAREISAALQQYGSKVPKSLVEALDAVAAVETYDPASDRPAVHTEALVLKASDVADLIDRTAESDLRLEKRREARVELGTYLAMRAQREALAAGAVLTDLLRDPFDAAAAAFTAAWRDVPARVKETAFDSDVIRAERAYEAVERAEDAAALLDGFNKLRNLLTGSVAGAYHLASRYGGPTSKETALQLGYRMGWIPSKVDPWGRFMELGIAIRWNTPAEQAQIVQQFEAEDTKRPRGVRVFQ